MSRESDKATLARMLSGEPHPMFTVGAAVEAKRVSTAEACPNCGHELIVGVLYVICPSCPYRREAPPLKISIPREPITRFRIYADGNVVHEDEFPEYDNSLPYYDDYAEYEVPDAIILTVIDDCQLGYTPDKTMFADSADMFSHMFEEDWPY